MKQALKHIGLNVALVFVPLMALVIIERSAQPNVDSRTQGVITISFIVLVGSIIVEMLKRFVKNWRNNKFVTYGPAIMVYLLFLAVVVQYYLAG